MQYCKSLDGYVIVGLNSDDSIRRLKGEKRPVVKQQDRKFMLESCKYVDEVIIFNEDTPYELMKQVKPDIIVKGGDYKKENIIGRDLATIEIFNYIDGYSTTKILEAK